MLMEIMNSSGHYNDSNLTISPTIHPNNVSRNNFVSGWVAIFLYTLVVILGVPGNGLVIWITAFNMKRSVNTIWFLNLAVADLLCCLSAIFSIMYLAVGYWPLGLFACKFIPSIALINMFASVLLLTMISVDRCVLVVKPVWCQNNRTIRKAYVACAVIWILAFILSIPFFMIWNISKSYGNEMCVYSYELFRSENQKMVENLVAVVRFLIGFIIPFLVIVTCYTMIIIRVRKRFAQNTKTMKVVLVVIVGFFICWLPYHVTRLILAFIPKDSEVFKSTLKVDNNFVNLAFMNSCVNPIIYVLMGQNMKSKAKKSIRLNIRNVLAEDESQSKDSRYQSDTRTTETSV